MCFGHGEQFEDVGVVLGSEFYEAAEFVVNRIVRSVTHLRHVAHAVKAILRQDEYPPDIRVRTGHIGSVGAAAADTFQYDQVLIFEVLDSHDVPTIGF